MRLLWRNINQTRNRLQMNRQDLINEAYKELPKWAKENVNDEGWIPHRYLLELLSFYNRDEIDFMNRDFVRPKILRV